MIGSVIVAKTGMGDVTVRVATIFVMQDAPVIRGHLDMGQPRILP